MSSWTQLCLKAIYPMEFSGLGGCSLHLYELGLSLLLRVLSHRNGTGRGHTQWPSDHDLHEAGPLRRGRALHTCSCSSQLLLPHTQP